MKELILLGSTGSIGTQALEVARKEHYRVTALAAGGKNLDLLEQQAREFLPNRIAVFDETAARDLQIRLKDTAIMVLSGTKGVCEVTCEPGDTVLNAIVGIAGLQPTLAAINAKKTVALANKETLVTGGEIVNRQAEQQQVQILPVDSEHSAIFQSLQGVPEGSLNSILLTASGGPFFGKTRAELENVTVEQALRHPNWSMGQKITIDSATMMNKGLEIIEAVHLFHIPADKIKVLVHRQSILHSAVELNDGAVIGQLGTPDMRLPIQYALTYPNRSTAFEHLDLFQVGSLTFEEPDTDTFRCMEICRDAIRKGGLYPTAVNGANEMAVALFLAGKIKFLQIADLVEEAYLKTENKSDFTLEDILETDAAARRAVLSDAKNKFHVGL